jgi:hypothetical protein
MVYSFEILRDEKGVHGLQIDLPKASEEDDMGVEAKTSQAYHFYLITKHLNCSVSFSSLLITKNLIY